MCQRATQAEPAPLQPPTPAAGPPRRLGRLVAGSLALVTLALYWPATSCDFVNFDDDVYVTANPHVQSGLSVANLKWACVNPVGRNWHPVTVWSHMLDCQLYGLKPWGHHLTSVVLHAVNTALFFLLLWGLTGALWPSVVAAALWGWHPLHVESVAWISERKDLLSGGFGLLALMAYVRGASPKSEVRSPEGQESVVRGRWPLLHLPASGFYLLSLALFALGLMSKPMLVTWPLVMLLLDYWPLGRVRNAEYGMRNEPAGDTQHAARSTLHAPRSTLFPLLAEKVPFFVLAAAVSLITLVVQAQERAVKTFEAYPLGVRAENALISYGRYLMKVLWPADLAVLYPHAGGWPPAMVALVFGLLLGVSVLLWVQRRARPCLLVGWLLYVGTLVPVIGVVQVGEQSMADRYTYLPSFGVLICVVWGAYGLTRGWRYRVPGLVVACQVSLVLCLALTRQQIGHWKDGEALFRWAVAVTEKNPMAHNNLGNALYRKGRIDEAIRHYQEAIRLKPDYADAHNNLGVVLYKKGQVEEAIRQFQEALKLKPGFVRARKNLDAVLAAKDRAPPPSAGSTER